MRKPIGQSAHVGPYARSASLRHGSLPGEDHGWFAAHAAERPMSGEASIAGVIDATVG